MYFGVQLCLLMWISVCHCVWQCEGLTKALETFHITSSYGPVKPDSQVPQGWLENVCLCTCLQPRSQGVITQLINVNCLQITNTCCLVSARCGPYFSGRGGDWLMSTFQSSIFLFMVVKPWFQSLTFFALVFWKKYYSVIDGDISPFFLFRKSGFDWLGFASVGFAAVQICFLHLSVWQEAV